MGAPSLIQSLIWRVVPWPTDEDQWPPEDCACHCGAIPHKAIVRGESLWYVCVVCEPILGFSFVWPNRRSRRRFRNGI